MVGARRTPWRDAGQGQTTGLAAGAATPLRERDRERGQVVSWWRHKGHGLWAVACSRQLEMREDPVKRIEPDFDSAVRRHRMLDAIVRASETGQRQKIAL